MIGRKSKGNIVITGNLVQDPDDTGGGTFAGISVQGGIVVADTSCVAATIGGLTNPGAWPSQTANAMNEILGRWGFNGFEAEIFVQQKGGTLNIPGGSVPFATFINNRNNIPDANGADVMTLGTLSGGVSCP